MIRLPAGGIRNLGLCALLGSCAAEEDRPPLLTTTGGPQDPISCDALMNAEAQPSASGRFFLSGGEAQCAVEGQWCPASWLSSRCDGGRPYARCGFGFWTFTCEEAIGDGA